MPSRGGNSGRGRGRENRQDEDRQEDDVVPTTFISWVVGVLQGDQHPWFLKYIESEIFKTTSKQLKLRTNLDVQWIVAACVALHSAKKYLPQLRDDVLGQIKSQATSSITLKASDATLQDGLVRFIRTSTVSTKSSWLNLHGRHEERDREGALKPLPGQLQQAFWFNDTLFLIHESKASDDNTNDWGCAADERRQLTVRCFGHTNEPIVKLLDHIKNEALKSEKLDVRKLMPGRQNFEQREKRPLSSIDMETKMRDQIQQEVEDFFHKDSKKLYSDTSRPYRHGFLFYGPPGTGKTSLSVAIASHACVPLVTITLRGMDDKDLEEAFFGIPIPSVVLMEDIDVSSAEVGKRSRPGEKKSGQGDDKDESTYAVEIVEAVKMIEQTIGQAMTQLQRQQFAELKNFRREQDLSNKAVLRKLNEQFGYALDLDDKEASHKTQAAPPAPVPKKSVTMSGLLNVIDGAASVEGRLLIMTTNHKEHLDDALIRPGRCDSAFEITYATKNSAEQTFKRIFGLDPNKKHHDGAIDRFAQAFKDQFPEESTISTAALAGYCARHRNRPVEAVENFAEWLRVGDEIFACSSRSSWIKIDGSEVNKPQPFDRALLQVTAKDFIVPAPELEQGEEKAETKRSVFNPLRLFLGAAPKRITAPVERLLLTAAGEPTAPEAASESGYSSSFVAFDLDWVSAVVERARKEELAHSRSAGPALVHSTRTEDSRTEIQADHLCEDHGHPSEVTFASRNHTKLSPHRASSPVVPELDSEEDDPLSPPLTASVKFFKEDGLKLVAPRPLDDAIVVSDQSSPTWSSRSDRSSDETDRDKSSKTSSATSLSASKSASLKSAGPSLLNLCCDEHKNDEWEDLDDDVGTMPDSVSVQLEDAGTAPEASHSSTNVTHAAAPNLSDEEGADEDEVFVDASE